jgi:RNA polymerase sigma-70 factor (ECF subfamily)
MAALKRTVPTGAEPTEDELVRRAQARDADAIRAIIKSHNQRLYRLARAITRSDADAEDVLQDSYLRAFAAIGGFRGEATLATWLSRITINQALGRLRRRKRQARLGTELAHQAAVIPFPIAAATDDPERTMAQRQLLQMVEQASDNLPEAYRLVFIARVVEGLSVEETADALDLRPATVKTRLHRARALVKQELETQIGPLLLDAFPFAGRRCDRLTDAVMAKLGLAEPS